MAILFNPIRALLAEEDILCQLFSEALSTIFGFGSVHGVTG